MIVLDTNVISEVMRDAPNLAVKTWFEQHSITDLYVTSVTMAEVLYGLYRLPEGKRKQTLLTRYHDIMKQVFQDRIFTFDAQHTNLYADIRATKDSIGRAMSNADAQIASIASYHDAWLATRNIKDFENCGIELINPFAFQA